MFNVTTSRPSRRKLSGARPPVCAGLSYPDGRGRLGLPSGLHPRATPANPGVQKGLILRGFLEAILRWREGGIPVQPPRTLEKYRKTRMPLKGRQRFVTTAVYHRFGSAGRVFQPNSSHLETVRRVASANEKHDRCALAAQAIQARYRQGVTGRALAHGVQALATSCSVL